MTRVLAAEAHDAGDAGALGVQRLGHGQGDGAAHAAAHHAGVLEALDLGRFAQGPDEIMDGVAFPEGC